MYIVKLYEIDKMYKWMILLNYADRSAAHNKFKFIL